MLQIFIKSIWTAVGHTQLYPNSNWVPAIYSLKCSKENNKMHADKTSVPISKWSLIDCRNRIYVIFSLLLHFITITRWIQQYLTLLLCIKKLQYLCRWTEVSDNVFNNKICYNQNAKWKLMFHIISHKNPHCKTN